MSCHRRLIYAERVPGAAQHGAKRSGTLQTRDPGSKSTDNRGPASAVHRFALHRVRDTRKLLPRVERQCKAWPLRAFPRGVCSFRA